MKRNLCERCSHGLRATPHVSSEQIASYVPEANHSGAVLIDSFGHAHPLGTSTIVGRTLKIDEVVIREPSVSRRHAEIRRNSSGDYELIDLGSTNGTFHNGERIVDASLLTTADRVRVGHIEFYFLRTTGALEAHAGTDIPTEELLDAETPEAPIRRQRTSLADTLAVARLEIMRPSGSRDGFLQLGDLVVSLTNPQLELIRALSERMTTAVDEPDPVRGYIPSRDLLPLIPWDTEKPTENHLKQLVVRVRRNLSRAGIDNLIESKRRLGYRLRVIPESSEST